jgi:hypothetical protein
MSTQKNVIFYYSTTNNQDEYVYRTLQLNGPDTIEEVTDLDYKKEKNFRMDSKYEETDADLFKFRAKMIEDNKDIMKHFLTNKDKVFKINLFNYNTMEDAIYNIIMVNSDQDKIKTIARVDVKEFRMAEEVQTCGLMSLDKRIIGETFMSYGYDFPKYYYNMMRKIKIPVSAPEYHVIDEIDFSKLGFGVYRVKIVCSNQDFWNIFKFNSRHHYLHSTLRSLYKQKDKYGIEFELLPADEMYDYNFVSYAEAVELKVLFRNWFKIFDKLLKDVDPDNRLVKSYIAQAWGVLSKYKKIYVEKSDVDQYDWGRLCHISKKKYDYYCTKLDGTRYTLVKESDPYTYKGLARIKMFLSEYSRNYMFDLLSKTNLAKDVIRIQTDSVSFKKPVDFTKLKLDYYPIAEAKTTGLITYYNVNYYRHWCEECQVEYKHSKRNPHVCIVVKPIKKSKQEKNK